MIGSMVLTRYGEPTREHWENDHSRATVGLAIAICPDQDLVKHELLREAHYCPLGCENV
jgi:hypothetical protein